MPFFKLREHLFDLFILYHHRHPPQHHRLSVHSSPSFLLPRSGSCLAAHLSVRDRFRRLMERSCPHSTAAPPNHHFFFILYHLHLQRPAPLHLPFNLESPSKPFFGFSIAPSLLRFQLLLLQFIFCCSLSFSFNSTLGSSFGVDCCVWSCSFLKLLCYFLASCGIPPEYLSSLLLNTLVIL